MSESRKQLSKGKVFKIPKVSEARFNESLEICIRLNETENVQSSLSQTQKTSVKPALVLNEPKISLKIVSNMPGRVSKRLEQVWKNSKEIQRVLNKSMKGSQEVVIKPRISSIKLISHNKVINKHK